MKRMSAVLQKFQNHRLKKYLIEDEVVMNWGILKKCILMLALGCGIHISWLSWDLFVLSHPQYWQHVHIDVVNDIFPIWQWVSLWFPCVGMRIS